MPRAIQSRESGIISYFKTADLAIAAVVLNLCKEALSERQQRSAEAKARAVKAPKHDAADLALSRPKPAATTAAPKKKGSKKKGSGKAKPKPKAPPTAASPYTEADLNDGAVIE